jgi:SAM-dependent methyltransferase
VVDAKTSHGKSPGALLGDTSGRNYARKLSLFNAFAEPELRAAIGVLALTPGARVLDAGCGSGVTLKWLADAVLPTGVAVGLDLAAQHTAAARAINASDVLVVQGSLAQPPLTSGYFDAIWCANTINHLTDPIAGLKSLKALLKPRGRIALAQSSLLPEMYFAWDERLERAVTEAVRRYYRNRYGLDEQATTAIRSLVGNLRCAGLSDVHPRTIAIERVSPLTEIDRAYLLEAIFVATWGERLRPYLSVDDFEQLSQLCDPQHADFALGRKDFHFLQTLTVVIGEAS